MSAAETLANIQPPPNVAESPIGALFVVTAGLTLGLTVVVRLRKAPALRIA